MRLIYFVHVFFIYSKKSLFFHILIQRNIDNYVFTVLISQFSGEKFRVEKVAQVEFSVVSFQMLKLFNIPLCPLHYLE